MTLLCFLYAPVSMLLLYDSSIAECFETGKRNKLLSFGPLHSKDTRSDQAVLDSVAGRDPDLAINCREAGVDSTGADNKLLGRLLIGHSLCHEA